MKKIRSFSPALTARLPEAAAILAGAALYGAGLDLFLIPGEIVTGGVGGIAVLLRILFDLPTGGMILLLNLPLLFLNALRRGVRFLARTAVGIAVCSLSAELFSLFPVTRRDPLLCALFGGALLGAGVGLLFGYGYNTGGTDLMATLLKERFPRLSVSRLVLLCDVAVILFSAVVLRRFDGILYSALSVGVTAFSIDAVEGGLLRSRTFFILSERSDAIAQRIGTELSRGVTLIPCRGWYTGQRSQMLLCAVKRSEVYSLRTLIASEDPDAFVIVADAISVTGEGFRDRAI